MMVSLYREVTNVGFHGCIDKVLVGGSLVNLNSHISAIFIEPGCEPKVSLNHRLLLPNVRKSFLTSLCKYCRSMELEDGLRFHH